MRHFIRILRGRWADAYHDFRFHILRRPVKCEECFVHTVVYPETRCEGCDAYREHTA